MTNHTVLRGVEVSDHDRCVIVCNDPWTSSCSAAEFETSRVHAPCPRDALSALSFERGHLREETECSSVIEGLFSCDVPLKQPVQTLETGPGNLTGKQGFLSPESWWKSGR